VRAWRVLFAAALLASLGASVSTARPACAQEATDTKARAERLFEQAKDLMKKADFATACAKFAESQRLDPALGTELNLGNCYEKEGRTASAWAVYKEAAVVARRLGQPERQKLAQDRVAALEPSLPTLRVVVGPSGAAPGFELRVDGVLLGRAEWDSSAPVDPGVHAVAAVAPGKQAWTTEIRVDAAGRAEVSVPLLADMAVAPLASPPAASAVLVADAGKPRGTGQRFAGVVLGGAGVVGLALGTVFGLEAKSENDSALTHCPRSPACNDPTGVNLTHQAENSATFSTVAFIAGGALLAGGAALFFTAPRGAVAPQRSAYFMPLVGPTSAGFAAGGEW
jgi:hypothetical protein